MAGKNETKRYTTDPLLRFDVKLRISEIEWMKRYAEKHKTSVAKVIRSWIDEMMEKEPDVDADKPDDETTEKEPGNETTEKEG